jgi:hypothetical protein
MPTTLLEAANQVLLSINERPLSNLSTVLGQQVRSCLAVALQTLMEESDWTWLETQSGALSWDSIGTATLPDNVQRIKLVQVRQQDNSWERVPFLMSDDFDELVPVPYAGSQNIYPEWYTLEGWNRVRVNPYPTDVTNQAKIRFKYLRKIDLPTLEQGTFECPEHFIQTLILRASQEFALRHSEDSNLTQMFASSYNQSVEALRSRHRQGQTNRYNMYIGNRRFE